MPAHGCGSPPTAHTAPCKPVRRPAWPARTHSVWGHECDPPLQAPRDPVQRVQQVLRGPQLDRVDLGLARGRGEVVLGGRALVLTIRGRQGCRPGQVLILELPGVDGGGGGEANVFERLGPERKNVTVNVASYTPLTTCTFALPRTLPLTVTFIVPPGATAPDTGLMTTVKVTVEGLKGLRAPAACHRMTPGRWVDPDHPR
jgi:hypothetical protein